MQSNDIPSSRTPGAVLIGVGLLLTAVAAASAFAAADHMATAAALCGPALDHCIACVLSAAGLLASGGVVAAGMALLAPRPVPQRSRRR